MFGHIIAEHTSAGGVRQEYIWLGDTPLAVFEGANLFYVHPDHLDRPVMMTNSAAQTIAWQAKYDPFGNPVTVTVSPVNNQRLPGQWFQIEDGLAYNWHRTYDPSLGRYSQADPLGFVDGPSVYGYAGQSPLMRVDPSGLHMSDERYQCYALKMMLPWMNCDPPRPRLCAAPAGMGPLPPLMSKPVPTPPVAGPDDWPKGERPPGEGWGWRGTGTPGGRDGGWVRPAEGGRGKETLHDDRDHPTGKPPHIGWVDGDGNHWENFGDGWVRKP